MSYFVIYKKSVDFPKLKDARRFFVEMCRISERSDDGKEISLYSVGFWGNTIKVVKGRAARYIEKGNIDTMQIGGMFGSKDKSKSVQSGSKSPEQLGKICPLVLNYAYVPVDAFKGPPKNKLPTYCNHLYTNDTDDECFIGPTVTNNKQVECMVPPMTGLLFDTKYHALLYFILGKLGPVNKYSTTAAMKSDGYIKDKKYYLKYVLYIASTLEGAKAINITTYQERKHKKTNPLTTIGLEKLPCTPAKQSDGDEEIARTEYWIRPKGATKKAPTLKPSRTAPSPPTLKPSRTAPSPPVVNNNSSLPPGWVSLQDTNKETYYQHAESGITQWEHPSKTIIAPKPKTIIAPKPKPIIAPKPKSKPKIAPKPSHKASSPVNNNSCLPSGWTSLQDDKAKTYYRYTDGSTQWEHPSLPSGWKLVQDDNDETYYLHTDGSTQWEDPRPLPSGWESLQDDNNNTYYYNKRGDTTTWERPCSPEKKYLRSVGGGGGGETRVACDDNLAIVFKQVYNTLLLQENYKKHIAAVERLWFSGKIATTDKDERMQQIMGLQDMFITYGNSVINDRYIRNINGYKYITKVTHWADAIEGLRAFDSQFQQISGSDFIKPIKGERLAEMTEYCKKRSKKDCSKPCHYTAGWNAACKF
jgi:hypothetical protein